MPKKHYNQKFYIFVELTLKLLIIKIYKNEKTFSNELITRKEYFPHKLSILLFTSFVY